MTINMSGPEKIRPAPNEQARLSDEATVPSYTSHATSPPTTSNLGPLPPGWEQRTTPEGRVYFINHNTRTNTWYDPRNSSATPADGSVSLGGELLPQRWEAKLAVNGTVYYIDHNTKMTTWLDPRVQIETENGLPTRWEERMKEDGTKYFVDHNTRTTTWTDPREPCGLE